MCIVGIPNLHWCGSQGNYNILIMDLLGSSLEELFNYCKRKFTLKTTLMLADQIVSTYTLIYTFIHVVISYRIHSLPPFHTQRR